MIIGNGGAEFGVRGYVSAYDAETGKHALALLHRARAIRRSPSKRRISRQAAKTWNGEWWKLGGGGTVWDSMAYDPELDLLYIGTGNGSPWNRNIRSPGGGDNLFLASIVALKPDTGEYVWHYQTTPGETWDYTATQHIDARRPEDRRAAAQGADAGAEERLLLRARSRQRRADLGEAVRADQLGDGRRPEDRPARSRIPRRASRTPASRSSRMPGPCGAHNWHPMSFSPQTGLVYIPAQEPAIPYLHDAKYQAAAAGVQHRPRRR